MASTIEVVGQHVLSHAIVMVIGVGSDLNTCRYIALGQM